MDYLTRRSIAALGHRSTFVRASLPRYPRLEALGVRVERDGTVTRAEIVQALTDIEETVALPADARLAGEMVEALLSPHTPEDLIFRVDFFLNRLAGRVHLDKVGDEIEAAGLADASSKYTGRSQAAEREKPFVDESRSSLVLQRAIEVLRDEASARLWLNTPQVALGEKKPIDLLGTDTGVENVVNVLGAIEDEGYL